MRRPPPPIDVERQQRLRWERYHRRKPNPDLTPTERQIRYAAATLVAALEVWRLNTLRAVRNHDSCEACQLHRDPKGVPMGCTGGRFLYQRFLAAQALENQFIRYWLGIFL